MMYLEEILKELRVVDLTKKKPNPELKKYFLAYKDKLFIMDENSPIHGMRARVKKHMAAHPAIGDGNGGSKWSVLDVDDVEEFLTRLSEISPDIVAGRYYPENKAITILSGQEVMPRTSLKIKKIAKQLDLQTVTFNHRDEPHYDDDLEINYSRKQLLGDVPDVVYHGTTGVALKNILKYGLWPGKGSTRFSSIIHKHHIFFTAIFQEAKYYAINATRAEKQGWGNYPIIIEFNVPDKRLLSPDYDADTYSMSKKDREFRTFNQLEPTTDMKPMTASREIGKWSYKGRIPASQIRWVYYYKPGIHKWFKSRPETWQKLLWNYDWDTLGNKLDLNDYT
jgi:hypothetical protein